MNRNEKEKEELFFVQTLEPIKVNSSEAQFMNRMSQFHHHARDFFREDLTHFSHKLFYFLNGTGREKKSQRRDTRDPRRPISLSKNGFMFD